MRNLLYLIPLSHYLHHNHHQQQPNRRLIFKECMILPLYIFYQCKQWMTSSQYFPVCKLARSINNHDFLQMLQNKWKIEGFVPNHLNINSIRQFPPKAWNCLTHVASFLPMSHNGFDINLIVFWWGFDEDFRWRRWRWMVEWRSLQHRCVEFTGSVGAKDSFMAVYFSPMKEKFCPFRHKIEINWSIASAYDLPMWRSEKSRGGFALRAEERHLWSIYTPRRFDSDVRSSLQSSLRVMYDFALTGK